VLPSRYIRDDYISMEMPVEQQHTLCVEEASVARQWHSKNVSMATNIPATIEQREAVFSLRSIPRLYNEDLVGKDLNTRGIYIFRSRFQATTSGDHCGLRSLSVCSSDL
jgi:hypothetical protein